MGAVLLHAPNGPNVRTISRDGSATQQIRSPRPRLVRPRPALCITAKSPGDGPGLLSQSRSSVRSVPRCDVRILAVAEAIVQAQLDRVNVCIGIETEVVDVEAVDGIGEVFLAAKVEKEIFELDGPII